MRRSWVFYRAAELMIALTIVAATLYIVDNVRQRSRMSVAASTWFTVPDIFVPDHNVGENPEIRYERSIKEPFQGFWVVEVQRQEGDAFVLECSGSGVNDYEPADYIPNDMVRWSWFIAKSCLEVPPGKYRLRASWVLRRDGWPEKTVVKYSNLFTVHARR